MSAVGPKPFNVDAEYAKLNTIPKIIITIAYYATMIFTFGTCTASVYEFLVRKFSILDLTQDTDQAKTARRADNAADFIKIKLIDTADHIEHLEQEFWEWMYASKTIKNFQLIASANKDQPKYITDFFLDQFFKERGEKEIVEPKQKMALAASIENNITNALKDEFLLELEEANETREIELSDKRVIQIFSTGADGSCGLHAISGVSTNGKYLCDAKVERALFIEWIRENNKFPHSILNDYFVSFNQSPSRFKNNPAVIEKYQALRKNYDLLTPAEKDARADEFAASQEVKEAYLLNLADPGVYLLQDELTLYAEYKKVNLVLFQKGWGRDADKISYAEVNTPGATSTVGVYYNGIDHFAHAKFKV